MKLNISKLSYSNIIENDFELAMNDLFNVAN